MNEPEPAADVIAQNELASAVIRLSHALDQTSELLEATTKLHRKVADLQAALAEPVVDLERLLVEAQKQTREEPE